MSGSISGLGGGSFGLMQQLIAGATATKARLDQLTMQSSTGYVASTYAGLDAASPGTATTALAVAPQIAGITNTIANLNAVTGRMGVQQTALSSISTIASSFMGQLLSVGGGTPQAMDTLAASARQALAQVAGLLDTQSGSVYVFGGQNSDTPPVPNPNDITSSGFFTNIQAAVASLATNGAAATEAATLATASSNAAGVTPFAAGLGAAPALPQVATGNGTMATVGIAANANGFVASAGTDTTGSYMRDIMRGLATIGSLTSSQVGSANFQGFAQATAASMKNAVTALSQDAGVLGNTQAALASQATGLQQTSTALTNQLAGADQVNMTSTLANLSSTQTQLQASYQIIAAMKTMSLTQYI